jgi:GT2 family glycosyltransferase
MTFRSELRAWRPGMLDGHVIDPARPDRRWVVSLLVNGQPVAHRLADADTPDASGPDLPADCGFAFDLNLAVLAADDILAVAVANEGTILGEIALSDVQGWNDPAARDRAGFVRHVAGLTLAGVLDSAVTAAPSYEVIAFDGDRIVGRTRLYRWQHIGDPASALARHVAFDLVVDAGLADGTPRWLRVETSTGVPLKGSPVPFVAFPDSFRTALRDLAAGGPLADMILDRLVENSAPLSAYATLYPGLSRLAPARPQDRRLADGTVRPLGAWALVHHAAVTPLAQLPPWKEASTGAGLVLFDLAVRRGEDLFPLLFPAFDAERALEQGYPGLLMLVPAPVAEAALAQGARSVFDVMVVALDGLDRDRILHVPHPAGVLDEAMLAGATEALARALQRADLPEGTTLDEVPGSTFPALRLRRPPADAAVSVIIPTRDRGDLLRACTDSLFAQNRDMAIDLLIVDNGTTDPAALAVIAALEGLGARVLEYDGGFNFALMNNLAAEHARAEQLVFLNNDVTFPMPGVLAELASRLAAPDVGAAGPLMARGSDIIQHGGVVLGPFAAPAHAFEDRMLGDPGHADLLRVAHEVAAVTAALMMTRRSLFLGMGGFDEARFAVNFNDVDWCLRLWAAGHRVIFTPHVHVRHDESVSRGRERGTPAERRLQRELDALRLRWRGVLANDPFFHPLYSIDTMPYRALATVHRAPGPRRSTVAPSADLPGWI